MYEISLEDAYFNLMRIKNKYKNVVFRIKNLTYFSVNIFGAFNRIGNKYVKRIKFFKTMLIANNVLKISLSNPSHHLFDYLYFFGPVEYKSFQATDGGPILGCVNNKYIQAHSKGKVYLKSPEELLRIINETDEKLKKPLNDIVKILNRWDGKDIIKISYMICRRNPFDREPQFRKWDDVNSDLVINSLSINLEDLKERYNPSKKKYINPDKKIIIDHKKLQFTNNRDIEGLKNGTVNPLIVYFAVYLLNKAGLSTGVGYRNICRLLACRLLYPKMYKRIADADKDYKDQWNICKNSVILCLKQLENLGLVVIEKKEVKCIAHQINFSIQPQKIDFEELWIKVTNIIPKIKELNSSFKYRTLYPKYYENNKKYHKYNTYSINQEKKDKFISL